MTIPVSLAGPLGSWILERGWRCDARCSIVQDIEQRAVDLQSAVVMNENPIF